MKLLRSRTAVILLLLGGFFFVASVIEYRTATRDLSESECDIPSVACQANDVRCHVRHQSKEAACKLKSGEVSKLLGRWAENAREFFRAIGKLIAYWSDILYWLEDYLWACLRILEQLFGLATSGFYVVAGYFDVVLAYVQPMGLRVMLGTAFIVFAVILALEPKTQWLNRALDSCKSAVEEERERNKLYQQSKEGHPRHEAHLE